MYIYFCGRSCNCISFLEMDGTSKEKEAYVGLCLYQWFSLAQFIRMSLAPAIISRHLSL